MAFPTTPTDQWNKLDFLIAQVELYRFETDHGNFRGGQQRPAQVFGASAARTARRYLEAVYMQRFGEDIRDAKIDAPGPGLPPVRAASAIDGHPPPR